LWFCYLPTGISQVLATKQASYIENVSLRVCIGSILSRTPRWHHVTLARAVGTATARTTAVRVGVLERCRESWAVTSCWERAAGAKQGTTQKVVNIYRPVVTICTTRFNVQQYHVRPTVYLCVLCGSENKQRFFHYTGEERERKGGLLRGITPELGWGETAWVCWKPPRLAVLVWNGA
jgi:hypothetical protein